MGDMKQEKIKVLYFFDKKNEARLIKVTTSKNNNKSNKNFHTLI